MVVNERDILKTQLIKRHETGDQSIKKLIRGNRQKSFSKNALKLYL